MSLILTCPQCATRYVASAEAFEPPGRAVRCSRCQHTWFQDVSAPDDYETLYDEYEEDPVEQQGYDEYDSAPRGSFAEDFTRDFADDFPPDVTSGFESNTPGYNPEPDFELPERRRGSRVVSALVGLLGTVAVFGALAAGAWFFRPQIIELVPKTEALYALLPAEQPASDYDFRNTGYLEATEEGRKVLIVSGEVVNQTDSPIVVPVVQVTMRTIAGRNLDRWKFKPRGDEIAPGEARYFETRRLNPPEGAQRLHLVIIEED